MTDKEIIKKFSDNHCLVLENNQISLREDEIMAYRIVLGKSTNELLEFVKDTYLQLKTKERECEVLQISDNEARETVAELKAECEELKKKVKELHQGWMDCDKESNLQEANSEFRQRVINRYKQTLTEIKEIAEEQIPYFNIDKAKAMMEIEYDYAGKIYNLEQRMYKILQKISEVLND